MVKMERICTATTAAGWVPFEKALVDCGSPTTYLIPARALAYFTTYLPQ